MIQANELRPNNWLLRHDGLQVQISNVGRKGTNIGPDDFPVYLEWDKFSPIPLTPEILEKCGFGTINNPNYTDSFLCYHPLLKLVFDKINKKISLRDYSGVRQSINYLHQLQNLYFSLTGEELNYTP